jgi:hypothetical protein
LSCRCPDFGAFRKQLAQLGAGQEQDKMQDKPILVLFWAQKRNEPA